MRECIVVVDDCSGGAGYGIFFFHPLLLLSYNVANPIETSWSTWLSCMYTHTHTDLIKDWRNPIVSVCNSIVGTGAMPTVGL